MKIFNKYIFGSYLVASSVLLSGCIDETVPTNGATEEQAKEASTANAVSGVAAYLNRYASGWSGSYHWAWAYGSLMTIRDIQSGDRVHTDADYDQYYYFGRNLYMSKRYVFMQYPWNYYTSLIKETNNVIGLVDEATASDANKGYLGAGYAFRAMAYLDFARCYEYLPTANTTPITDEGNDVSGLTVPIVTETTTEEESRNNPRVSHEKMAEFIENDLNKAEELIVNIEDTNNGAYPTLACVYGLKARLYMWNEDYAKAKQYARLAIDNAGISPMSEDDCLDPTLGFNTINKWMWGASQNSENGLVQTGIVNWASWATNQTQFGYTGVSGQACPTVMINRHLYDRISNTDFRKLEFLGVEPVKPSEPDADLTQYITDSTLWAGVRYISAIEADCKSLNTYAAFKFRPAQGNTSNYTTACSTSYPLMRVEEMYFIEAEAAAHLNPSEGIELITNFMKTYRDPEYKCTVTDKDDVVEEIVFQKRIELWGEGQSFFDIKRLNYSVTKSYTGTNVPDVYQQNTNGRPAWMNYCIVQTEENNNAAVRGWNNPDPSGKESK